MRTFFLALLISAPALAEIPGNGMYRCVNGNNNSICDQDIRVKIIGNKATAVKVMYEGDCAGQGPYTYYCQDSECTDGAIYIRFKDQNSYSWENRPHGFLCEMKKI